MLHYLFVFMAIASLAEAVVTTSFLQVHVRQQLFDLNAPPPQNRNVSQLMMIIIIIIPLTDPSKSQ